MISAAQALIASAFAGIEARLALIAALIIRRAALVIAATLCGVGALLFLSIGIFFGLSPGLGQAGAALIVALIWAVLAAICLLLARARPSRAAILPPPVAVAPPVAPAAATVQPGVVPPGAVPPGGLPPGGVAPGGGPPRSMAAGLGRAMPALALAALVAGIFAARR